MARRANDARTLTAHHDCEFREMLDRVGDKWSLLVIAMLEQRPTQRARFSELKRSIPGISQRMLTATLRSLERDGLLSREIFPEVAEVFGEACYFSYEFRAKKPDPECYRRLMAHLGVAPAAAWFTS